MLPQIKIIGSYDFLSPIIESFHKHLTINTGHLLFFHLQALGTQLKEYQLNCVHNSFEYP